jgi:alpha-galactosidase/6-phospho-beta-glucosidase family protein
MERDLNKACLACIIDPCTAASATPSDVKACFNKLLELEARWLEPFWGKNLKV